MSEPTKSSNYAKGALVIVCVVAVLVFVGSTANGLLHDQPTAKAIESAVVNTAEVIGGMLAFFLITGAGP